MSTRGLGDKLVTVLVMASINTSSIFVSAMMDEMRLSDVS